MKKVLLALLVSTLGGFVQSYSQSRNVTGCLTDSGGEAIAGVNILIKGTTTGTVTDINGYYTIEAPVGSVLVFSSVGFTTREMVVTEEAVDKTAKRKKNHEAGSIESPVENNPVFSGDSLGSATLTAFSPSYVILSYNNHGIQDAIKQPSGSYNFPYYVSDVKYVSKTALWKKYRYATHAGTFIVNPGYTSFFGVRLNYFASMAWNGPTQLPKLQTSFAQGRPESGHLTWRGPETGEVYSWGPPVSQLEFDGSSYLYDQKGKLTPLGSGTGGASNSYDPYTFFRKGTTANHSLDLKLNYRQKWFAELGYNSFLEKGIIPGSRNASDHFKLVLEKKGNGIFEVKYGIDYTQNQSRLTSRGSNLSNLFYSVASTPPSFDNKNNLSHNDAENSTVPYLTSAGGMRSYAPNSIANPYFFVQKNSNLESKNSLVNYLNFGLNLGNFDLTYKVGHDRYLLDQRFSHFEPGFWDFPNVSSRRETESENLYSQLEARFMSRMGTYDLHRLDAHIIGEFANSRFNFDRQNAVFAGSSEELRNRLHRNSYQISKKVSYHFQDQLNIDLQNSIYLSSTLSSNRYFNPSAGVSLNLNSFPDGLNFLSYAKFYSSYSTGIGELPLSYTDLGFNTLYYTSAQFPEYFEYGELFYTDELLPETSQKFEVGTDLHFWYNAFVVGANYYDYLRKDAIYPVLSPITYQLVNGADIRSYGFEAYVAYSRYWSNISWKFGLNFSRNRSITQDLLIDRKEVPYAGFSDIHKSLIEGEPVGVLVGTRYERNREGQLIIGEDGYPVVDDETGRLGDPNPDWTAGIENNLNWRGFGLSFLIAISKGGDVWNGTQNVLNYHGTSKITESQRATRDYLFEGVNRDGQRNTTLVDFAPPESGVNENRWVRYGLTGVAEEAIEDGSSIRLRELELSYEVPGYLLDPLYLSKVKISAFSTNLFVITKYKGVDPGTSLFGYAASSGLDLFNIPPIRSYGLKLKVTL